MTKTSFIHVGLTCVDPGRTEKYYTKHFGFSRARVVPLGGADQIVFLKAGNAYLELFKAKEKRPTAPPTADGYPYPGLRHLAFAVDNVEAKIAEMGNDAKVLLGPLHFDDFLKGWAGAWIADPDENVIELSQGYIDEANPPQVNG